MPANTTVEIRSLIRDVPDFPKPGVVFKDITPLLAHPDGLRAVTEALAARLKPHAPSAIVAVESRGFLFGAPLALHMGLPLIIVRKPGKLPRATESISFALEYGTDSLHLHADAISPEGRYAIVDDVLATGGTAAAVAALIARLGGTVAAQAFLIELGFLGGRSRLGAVAVESLERYA